MGLDMKITKTHVVAVYPPGDSFARVLVPNVECSADAAHETAKHFAQKAIEALAQIPMAQWRTAIVSVHDIQDVKSKK